MKSIIHEASTIAKAFEQGWIKAGKPKDFTVKIFEEPQKNFFGFTTKNAKIGIFVEDRQQRQEHRPKKHIPQHRRQQRHRKSPWGDQQDRQFDRQDGQRHHQDRQQFRHDDHKRQDRHQDQQRQQHESRQNPTPQPHDTDKNDNKE